MPVDTSATKWIITGVSPATQRAARAAARQQNMTLAAWIEQAVEAKAAEDREGKPSHRVNSDYRPNRRYF